MHKHPQSALHQVNIQNEAITVVYTNITLTQLISAISHSNLTPTKETLSPLKPSNPMPRGPAIEWTIEEVIQFITATDAALGVYANLFRKHVRKSSLEIVLSFRADFILYSFRRSMARRSYY